MLGRQEALGSRSADLGPPPQGLSALCSRIFRRLGPLVVI